MKKVELSIQEYKEMLDAARSASNKDLEQCIVIAFPGGKGTDNCVKTAVGYNMIVFRVEQ